MKKQSIVVVFTLLALGIGLWVFAWSGFYDIGADRPHTALVHSFLNTLRTRSIATHARDIKVPPLDDAEHIAEGAEHYAAMCTGCHLAPGMDETEIRRGLLPQPPNLSQQKAADAAETFWIIKHGIKATAMPAWGKTHDDEEIWNLVAFVKQLPGMTPKQYRAATASDAGESPSAPAREPEHGHEHHRS